MSAAQITYDFPLRPDLVVRCTLPIDLTVEDAERWAEFVRALAFAPVMGPALPVPADLVGPTDEH